MLQADVADHPIQGTFSDFLELQKSGDLLAQASKLTEHEASRTDYCFSVVRIIRGKLKTNSAKAISPTGLRTLNNQLRSSLQELTSFKDNGDKNHLVNAANNAEEALRTSLWVLPKPSPGADKAIHDEIAALSSAASDMLKRLDDRVLELTSKLEAQSAELAVATQALEEAKTRADQSEVKLQAELSSLDAKFKEFTATQNAEIDTFASSLQSKFTTETEGSLATAKGLIEKIEAQHDRARDIVQVVGNIGTTGNYSNTFSEETKQADRWRYITVGLFGSGILLAGGTLAAHIYQEFRFESYEPDILSLGLRFLVGIVVALPAFYTARESARHRTNADRAKQTELELATLDPFIEFLPEDQKVELKAKLTERYFGNSVEAHDFKSPVEAKELTSVLEQLAKLVEKLKS